MNILTYFLKGRPDRDCVSLRGGFEVLCNFVELLFQDGDLLEGPFCRHAVFSGGSIDSPIETMQFRVDFVDAEAKCVLVCSDSISCISQQSEVIGGGVVGP